MIGSRSLLKDGTVSPGTWHQGRQWARAAYFFFVLACLVATACFFCCSALLALDCFCEDFFWFDFGDLSPMCFAFFSELTDLRNRCFPTGAITLRAAARNVNDGRAWLILARPDAREELSIAGGSTEPASTRDGALQNWVQCAFGIVAVVWLGSRNAMTSRTG